MRTAPTLCASGAGIGLASIGLAVIREKDTTAPASTREPSPVDPPMTAVAAYPPTNLTSSFAFSTPPTARSVSEGPNGKARLGNARVGQKRSLTPRTSLSTGMERPAEREDGNASPAGTPTAQPPSWLRRLSSSMSSSRDSSQTPVSRPGSAAVSQSNGSMAYSHAGSTTPMVSAHTPPPLPPNKLVKRSSSLRSASGSPFQSSGSRLPLPVFRRPATSHQRSATFQDRHSGGEHSDHMSTDENSSDSRDQRPQQYFTPRVAADELLSTKRRNSSGIPNPIRRVYPDRKYRPVLVSATDNIKAAPLEVDDEPSLDEDSLEVTKLTMAPSAASSPLPVLTTQFEGGETPRRSFSIGDLLSTGPQPLWRRPSHGRSKPASSKLVRRGRQRVASAPQAAMGSALSKGLGGESERPAKRRDLTDPQAGQRSIYSSASSNQHADAETGNEIELNLGSTIPQYTSINTSGSHFAESTPPATNPTPLEPRRIPSVNLNSATARSTRLSAAQSEITSTVGSDSECRSIGDASTDYQSDTPYDSYATRTTRSSSNRRGPPIERIFDESPPNFSSGRSTRLKDLLTDGAYSDEHGIRYRHSTIEEEDSLASTPVRSIHDKSVTSTPSARPGTQQLFGSSPPATMSLMPDPDEIDWDAPDDEPVAGSESTQRASIGSNRRVQKSLPFRFGPNLKTPYSISANTTPQRQNGNGSDRANLFDWAEAQPSPSHNQSPPRPRTVHGKKEPDTRGSRASGRRAPSGMHARSHSVPVAPEADSKRANVVANKFGTWGVGSKGVTEDWNDDFEFEEQPPMPVAQTLRQEDKRIDSGHEMFVPISIREQQENVVANIGLLREWGLLIEELKELRIRAVAVGMMKGPYAQAWEEVDAMIELADQESEEHTLEPRRSPPSSPGFDYAAFEDHLPNIAGAARPRGQTGPSSDPVEQLSDLIALPDRLIEPSTPHQTVVSRPRKDSEAVARSVIEALQSRRRISDPAALKAMSQSRKVPFDTATLRHIVPYVNSLKRKVKDALRETEGLYSSPRRRTPPEVHSRSDDEGEPPFRSIFNEGRGKLRREEAITDHDGFEIPLTENSGDLTQRLQKMNLPR